MSSADWDGGAAGGGEGRGDGGGETDLDRENLDLPTAHGCWWRWCWWCRCGWLEGRRGGSESSREREGEEGERGGGGRL